MLLLDIAELDGISTTGVYRVDVVWSLTDDARYTNGVQIRFGGRGTFHGTHIVYVDTVPLYSVGRRY